MAEATPDVLWIKNPDEGTETSFDLDVPRVCIGRSRSNEICIPDRQVSRHHAELIRTSEGWQIADLGSKNGTYVNGIRLSVPRVVEAGDAIGIGHAELVVGGQPDVMQTRFSVTEAPDSGRTMHSIAVADASDTALGRVLVQAARLVASDEAPRVVLERLIDLALTATGAERGVIVTLDEDQSLHPYASVTRTGTADVSLSRHVVERVLSEGQALIVEDISTDAQLGQAQTIIDAGLRAVLCSPLGTELPPRGMFYLDSAISRVRFTPSHLEVVSTLAGMAAVTLENAEARVHAEREKFLETQLAAAAEIQGQLLSPSNAKAPPGFSCAGRHLACYGVGGDFYEFFSGEGGYGVVLADVAGKGLSAALLMANLQAHWRSVRASDLGPEAWLSHLNSALEATLPSNRFITLAFALSDPDSGRLVFGSAGHSPGIHLHDGEISLLEPTGPVLGLLPDLEYSVVERPFTPGDRVILYSDGITEQADADEEEYEMERLTACVRSHGTRTAPELLDRILSDVDAFAGNAPQQDDMTLVILGREE